MSLDVTGRKTWYYNEYIGFDTKDEIAGFTLSSRLNDYWGTHDFFINNADEVFDKNYDNVYVYSRESLFKLQEKNKELNLGEDVDVFLNDCINSNADKVYIEIY